MDFQTLVHSHKSIRRYKKESPSDEVLMRVLEAALRASSSGNMQSYSIIMTKDLAIRKSLLEAHFHQSMLVEAPVLMTFCADFGRMRRWLELSEAPLNFDNFMSFMIGAIDAILASQNAALAAENEGLGICYMGTTLASCLKISKLLKCPDHVVPVVGFSLGYPDEAAQARDRLPLKAVLHKETYNAQSDEEILDFYSEREKAGMKRYSENSDLAIKIKDLDIKNLAQVYTKLKYTRESHIEYSKTVFECLRTQGFLGNQELK